jgi:pimeloyl-ACP methyl ester carboxylesterase
MKAPPLPGSGRLVSLGTHRLHLRVEGQGRPAVVFDAALGGSSLSWTYVEPAVAEFTTACTYDRAGFGWSDAGPMPRTVERIAGELHELLVAAAIEPPYVLVGHSFGGLSIRAYAARYPGEAAGLVFVDPAHPEEWRAPSAAERERLQRGATLCRRGAIAAKLGIATLVARLASAGALDLARGIAAAASRRTLHRNDEEILAPVTRLPMDVRAALRWMWTQPRYFEALGSQIEHVAASAATLDVSPGYGSLPLITISATDASQERRRLQDALASRSARGRHIFAAKSGHWIPIEEPQLVVDAIREVVLAVRASAQPEP